MPQPVIVTATAADLPDLWRLECACFDATRRTTRRSLRHSLQSRHQRVRLLRRHADEQPAAYATLFLHRRTLRIYSIAVAPDQQGRGLGKALVQDAIAVAVQAGVRQVSLEVDALDAALVGWYERQGFAAVARLDDYYAPGRPAVRMRRPLGQPEAAR